MIGFCALGTFSMSRALAWCFVLMGLALPLPPQTVALDAHNPKTTLQINSRAVLVDVIVTDSLGKPVTGLRKDAFTVTEQGKPQTISFFEEHGAERPAQPVEMPKMPPDVFTNFSPFPQPPAVNVLLLDSLNTRMESQGNVYAQAVKFLKSAKPGTRTAILISREEHVAGLNIKPDAYAIFQNTGVQLHAELTVPKGNYWLRTGVYDQGSHKVGTMEIALSSVVPLQVSAK